MGWNGGRWEGGSKGRGFIPIADLSLCTEEMNTTLYSSYTLIKKKNLMITCSLPRRQQFQNEINNFMLCHHLIKIIF